MIGWQIFVHALRMVYGNFKQVLQITIGPALIAIGVLVAIGLINRIPSDPIYFGAEGPSRDPADVFVGGFLFMFLLIFAVFLWVAVAWHRFVLLEEYPKRILPTFHAGRIFAYFGQLFVIGLMVLALFVPLALLSVGLGQGIPAVAALILLIGYLFVLVITMRLSITLPATAIGQPLTFRQAWDQTQGANGVIVVMLLASIAFQVILQLVLAVFGIIPVIGALLSVFVGLIVVPVLNLSLLTTMYGVFIQKRQLI